MGADCKSVGVCLPRFESWTCHPGQRLFFVGPRDAQMLAGTQLVRTGSRVERIRHRVQIVGEQVPAAVERQRRRLVLYMRVICGRSV